MTRHAATTAFVLLLALALPGAAHGQGRLVIAGGGVSRDNDGLYRAVLEGRHGDGPICVIPTASADLESARGSMESSVATFEHHGGAGAAVGILLSVDNAGRAADDDVVRTIRGCAGFYFTGGVQSRTVRVLRPGGTQTPALEALLQRFRDGALVGGSSAGAAIMSDPMIAGGSTTTALSRGVRRGPVEADEDDDGSAGGVSVTAGIGFLTTAIVDQHFLARGRIGRLIAAVLDLDEFDLGFGVDEDTGLVVDGTTAFAVGASGVIIVDARDATRDGRAATNLRLHLMAAGDRYDTTTRRLELDSAKRPLTGAGEDAAGAGGGAAANAGDRNAAGAGDRAAAGAGRGAAASAVAAPDDIFARWAFLHLLEAFSRSAQTELVLPFDGGTLVLRKGADFAAVSGAGPGVQGTPAGLAIRGVLVEVLR